MQVSVEILDGLQRRLTVQVPSDDIDAEVARRLRDLSRRVRLDGFRPGKVPLKVVKRRYGESVLQEVTQELIEKRYTEALTQEQLRPASGPKIHVQRPREGEDYKVEATFEIYPELDLRGVETLRVKQPSASVTEADVEEMLQKLRQQRQTWHPAQRPAVAGDRVTIDFRGTLEGESEPFPGGSGEGLLLIIGGGGVIPGFSEQLIGAESGEERQLSLTFPGDYRPPELAGRAASFQVSVKAVEAGELPQVDAELARSFGVEDGSVDELRSELRANLERELTLAVRRNVKEQVLLGLLQANPVPLPNVLVEGEIRSLARQADALPQAQDDGPAALDDELRARFRAAAEQRVALGLLMTEILRRSELKPDPARVHAEIERIAASYQRTDEVKEWYRRSNEAMRSVSAMVLEDQVVDWVLERCQVEEQPSTFAELTRSPTVPG